MEGREQADPQPGGPRLAVVHGACGGKAFAPSPGTADDDRWSIGRAPEASVCLDYDPFVSREHAFVVPDDASRSGFALVDEGASRNGTLLNWYQVERGTPHPLATGDVLGVGRSTLVVLGL